MQLSLLESGSREMFKAMVHGVALAVVAVMDVYNIAAWIQRREPHLAVNSLIYTALVFFEYEHVMHHRASALEAAAMATIATAAAADAAVDEDAA